MSCLGAGAVALLLVSSCGTRTSMLDQEAYGEGGSATSGGSSSTPTAGNGSKPSGGSSGVDPSGTTCQQYCDGYAKKCQERLEGRDCTSACSQEMNNYGARCQSLGMKALKCLTPYFQNASLSCDVAVGQALEKCSPQVGAFDDCKGVDEPTPQPPQPQPPQPQPNPPRPMPQPNPVGACPGTGDIADHYCKVSYFCPDGQYTTSCMRGADWYDCVCYWPSGPSQSLRVVDLDAPCDSAAAACGFMAPILK